MPVFYGFFERFLVVHVNFGVSRGLVTALEFGEGRAALFFCECGFRFERLLLNWNAVYGFQLCSRGLYVNVHAAETRDEIVTTRCLTMGDGWFSTAPSLRGEAFLKICQDLRSDLMLTWNREKGCLPLYLGKRYNIGLQ